MGGENQSGTLGDMMNKSGRVVGITFSTFDLLHAGHVQMLAEAKRQCDYLICGLQIDPSVDHQSKNKPTQSLVERYIQLRGCQYVDEIVPYATEQDLEDILQAFKIDVRILGDEYKDKNFTGRSYCEDTNIQLYFNSRDHRFSSSRLREIISGSELKGSPAINKSDKKR
ncbi:adenylyltransferase/cytidyltransferase family protein [Sphingobacterium deserti]|uniref:Cytidyltransferase-related domain protein n=1 Tax=Sphingobacterium deserti TaxID=1229276 RepID=A0A0B8T8L5_9SPHI|nr:adenylyltransferase/cytidyltransferase family protein [Sphingobacterium deserti]KGE14275.1 cytidyltransferase-related domain protein [Sphingobacterium deserti]